jgi:hypothetical protein
MPRSILTARSKRLTSITSITPVSHVFTNSEACGWDAIDLCVAMLYMRWHFTDSVTISFLAILALLIANGDRLSTKSFNTLVQQALPNWNVIRLVAVEFIR